MKKNQPSYKNLTFRRKMLDYLQEKYKHLYSGIVLDIGGRDKGFFEKPKNQVKKWIFADINPDHNPDLVLNVKNMGLIGSDSIDLINAIELFEHVDDIDKGLQECYRVLKKDGRIIISCPFMHPIHADPYDFQRWTHLKWRKELNNNDFKVEKMIAMGKYFTHLAETIKIGLPRIRYGSILSHFFHILFKVLIRYDNKSKTKNDPILKNYHCGYFIIAKKE